MKNNINKIIEYLNQDLIILSPTDTVFGLLANSYSQIAIENLYKIKNRPIHKTFAVFIHPKFLDQYTNLNQRNRKLFEKFTPGPVTFIVKNTNKNLDHISLNNKIAIRIPDNDDLLELLMEYKKPLVATSANISGEENPKNFKEINQFIKTNPLVALNNLESHYTMSHEASSIFDISDYEIKTIRQGNLKIEEIQIFLKSINL
jgi:L-threonylcarbamoyladenylate synthase